MAKCYEIIRESYAGELPSVIEQDSPLRAAEELLAKGIKVEFLKLISEAEVMAVDAYMDPLFQIVEMADPAEQETEE